MKCLILPALLVTLLTPWAASALDTSTRPVAPVRSWSTGDLDRFNHRWLQVKFVEGSNVVLDHGLFADDSGLDLKRVNLVVQSGRTVEISRTFSHDRALLRRWKAMGEMKSGVTGPDLSLWFDIRTTGGPAEIARLVNELNACHAVEIAHPIPIPEPAVLVNGLTEGAAISAGTTGSAGSTDPANLTYPAGSDTPDFTGMQDYLYDPPTGLDGPAAWDVEGGQGEGMKFIDVEGAWTEDHEDFAIGNYFYSGGHVEEPSGEPHGTAVIGEVIGQHNDYGISGFAPSSLFGTVAVNFATYPNVSQYFQEAIDQLDAGDVWLIELQMFPGGRDATPMEYLQANYDVIWTGVFARGVVCVEAGANGAQDLDHSSWGGIFDRSVRDSGAIMVGAGTPTGRVAESFTNWGSRMDVHAWGSEIVSTGSGDLYNGGTLQTRYTAFFGGTSGASPMVVGASLCLQGIARANLGRVLDPLELRSILHDTGVPHLDAVKEIGPRPDLGAAVPAVLTLAAPMVVTGPGPDYDNPPLARLFPPEDEATHDTEFTAYSVPHHGVKVAVASLAGAAAASVLTGAGPGRVFGPHVRAFASDGTPVPGVSFLAYGTNKYGVNVAAGDLNGDGYDEIITGAGPGAVFGPHVRAFGYDGSAVTPLNTVSYFAYGTHRWGVEVAAGDLDGDGYDEIVTGAGPGAVFGPHVRGWNVDEGAAAAMPAVSFMAYGTFRYGVKVTCGDVDGDGIDEIVTAPGPSPAFAAHIRGWNYDGAMVGELEGCNFFAWPAAQARYGANVSAVADLDGNGRADLVVGPGPDPSVAAPVRVFEYTGSGITEQFSFQAYDEGWNTGASVAAGHF